jgi:hypothetical protein
VSNGTNELDPDAPSDVKRPACIRCGRELVSLRSQRCGYGHECLTAILTASNQVDMRDWTAEQVQSALTLLRDGGIVLWRQSTRNLVYRSIATDGVTHYMTTIQACNCTAGRWERACYHRLAVTILQLSRETSRSRRRDYRKSEVT